MYSGDELMIGYRGSTTLRLNSDPSYERHWRGAASVPSFWISALVDDAKRVIEGQRQDVPTKERASDKPHISWTDGCLRRLYSVSLSIMSETIALSLKHHLPLTYTNSSKDTWRRVLRFTPLHTYGRFILSSDSDSDLMKVMI